MKKGLFLVLLAVSTLAVVRAATLMPAPPAADLSTVNRTVEAGRWHALLSIGH